MTGDMEYPVTKDAGETIKINREMLVDAWNKAQEKGTFDDLFQRLEMNLFGPKKPRQWWVVLGSHGNIEFSQSEIPKYGKDIKSYIHVSEVLD